MSYNISREVIREHMLVVEGFVNAEMPAWYYAVECAIDEVALIKTPPATQVDVPDVRPIGMGGCKRRSWTSRPRLIHHVQNQNHLLAPPAQRGDH